MMAVVCPPTETGVALGIGVVLGIDVASGVGIGVTLGKHPYNCPSTTMIRTINVV
jgi:hypothetical protein